MLQIFKLPETENKEFKPHTIHIFKIHFEPFIPISFYLAVPTVKCHVIDSNIYYNSSTNIQDGRILDGKKIERNSYLNALYPIHGNFFLKYS